MAWKLPVHMHQQAHTSNTHPNPAQFYHDTYLFTSTPNVTSYDVARLCQPFLKELADLQDGSIFKTIAKQWGEKLGLRPVDLGR